MRKHEVVIIGGSLAGAACVRELRRLNIDAVAYERDRFPRPKVCGGFVSPGGVECLDRLGVLDDVRNAGAANVTAAKVRVDDVEVEIPFKRPGIGVSRSALDHIVAQGAAVEQGCAVTAMRRTPHGFLVTGSHFEVACTIVIDAAGKLSRFTQRKPVEEFGVQYTEAGSRGSILDFWFGETGYGGAVSIEGGQSNYCFLVRKDKLPLYLGRQNCQVTGPLAYDRVPGEIIAIGDAAGMVDPFCGEGMRHALDTGILAAKIVARGIRSGADYEQMRHEYEAEWRRRWSRRRAVGAAIRRIIGRRKLFGTALRFAPAWLLNQMWEN